MPQTLNRDLTLSLKPVHLDLHIKHNILSFSPMLGRKRDMPLRNRYGLPCIGLCDVVQLPCELYTVLHEQIGVQYTRSELRVLPGQLSW